MPRWKKRGGSRMKVNEYKDKIESLEIQLKYLENDYHLTKEEYEKSTAKYLEILKEFKKKNDDLKDLQKNLEKIVEDRTRELNESQKILLLKGSEQQIMLDASPEMIFYKDFENRFVRINKSFIEFIGFPYKSVVGKSDTELFNSDNRKEIFDCSKVIESGKPELNKNVKMETPAGKRWIKLDKIPYKGSDGNIVGVIGFALDITEKINADEQKKNLEEQLFQAQKMESIGRLAGGIAHDFNNILSTIMGYAELLNLKLNKSSSLQKKSISTILKSTKKASSLIKKLLGFARSGKSNPVPLFLNDLIQDILCVSEKIFEKKIRVLYDLNDYLNIIEADKNQLDQVFTNLIINARDAMPEGGVLTFKTENVVVKNGYKQRYSGHKPGSYAKVSVSDTGTGMSKKIVKKIFEPFFTTKEEGKGTGLGLATVYGIIQNHNGFIDVKSEIGSGTTFELYFPVTEKGIVEEQKEEDFIKGSGTILFADDEDDVRIFVNSLLKEIGYDILLAKDGFEAIEIYEEKKKNIDLVILNMIMPKMHGSVTFDKLRKINPDVKVLISSGYNMNKKVSEVIKKGAMGFLPKPFSLSELSFAINEVLSNGRNK